MERLDLGRWTVGILLVFWIPVYWIGRRLRQLRASSEIQEVESLLALDRLARVSEVGQQWRA
jgi:hypothetical protein